MTTVLPTPAPPNRPALPPRRPRQRRSMTLTPGAAGPGRGAQGSAGARDGAARVGGLEGGREGLRRGRQVLEAGRGPMDRPHGVRVFDGTLLVDGLPEDVDHAPEHALADGYGYRLPRVGNVQTALEAIGRGHGHRANHVVA